MKTNHKVVFSNSNKMKDVDNASVNLVVTSPPYPMIEMWDELFSNDNTAIKTAIQKGEGMKAYDLMNMELYKTWREINRVLSPGGIVCINIGDATRKIGNTFQIYANHSRITYFFEKMGYHVLPLIIWRKETNKPTKFMGSGMLPCSAYVTLEHEYILIFRKGMNRNFNVIDKQNRRKSAFFWEERNIWFSDIWNDLKGIDQNLNRADLRNRSAAYPFELAYRLINMYSVERDVILDPFLGTGTTMFAAMCSGRNSIGYEIDPNMSRIIDPKIDNILYTSNEIIEERIKKHINFINTREDIELKYKSLNYGFPVMTNQEEDIFFPIIEKIEKKENFRYDVFYGDKILNNKFNIIKRQTDIECAWS